MQTRGLFVTFPDENAQAPSKSQLKKLAKKGGDNPKAAAAAEFKAKEAASNGGAENAKPVAEEAKSEASTQP